jgi:rod shape-determining protein MreC
MYQGSGYQGSSIFNSSNKISANVYQTAASVREYLFLKEENKRLAEENAKLYNMLRSGYMAVSLNRYTKKDTLYKQQYTYVSAKAVNSSINRRRNYITVNIGSDQGVARHMAVVNSDGVVGRITDVSRNFSTVMSLLHKDNIVNCQLKMDGTYGPLVWDGNDYRYCLLKDIPASTKIKKGDVVETSEQSGIFPEGIKVGTVESFEQRSGEPFLTVKVKLVTDFKKLNYVFVIKNKFKTERDSLESATQVESEK